MRLHFTDREDTPKVHWLNELVQEGLEPKVVILQPEIATVYSYRAESGWIAYGRKKGWPLTNRTKGSRPHWGYHLDPAPWELNKR